MQVEKIIPSFANMAAAPPPDHLQAFHIFSKRSPKSMTNIHQIFNDTFINRNGSPRIEILPQSKMDNVTVKKCKHCANSFRVITADLKEFCTKDCEVCHQWHMKKNKQSPVAPAVTLTDAGQVSPRTPTSPYPRRNQKLMNRSTSRLQEMLLQDKSSIQQAATVKLDDDSTGCEAESSKISNKTTPLPEETPSPTAEPTLSPLLSPLSLLPSSGNGSEADTPYKSSEVQIEICHDAIEAKEVLPIISPRSHELKAHAPAGKPKRPTGRPHLIQCSVSFKLEKEKEISGTISNQPGTDTWRDRGSGKESQKPRGNQVVKRRYNSETAVENRAGSDDGLLRSLGAMANAIGDWLYKRQY